MPIKNYAIKPSTTAASCIAAIQDSLVKHGASGISFRYENGRVEAMQFMLLMPSVETPENLSTGRSVSFALPVAWHRFQQVMKQQKVPRWKDEEYCYRVAWANIRDWVLAQMALYETQMVTLPQIFLPFATDRLGRTLFEKMAENPSLLLDGPQSRA